MTCVRQSHTFKWSKALRKMVQAGEGGSEGQKWGESEKNGESESEVRSGHGVLCVSVKRPPYQPGTEVNGPGVATKASWRATTACSKTGWVPQPVLTCVAASSPHVSVTQGFVLPSGTRQEVPKLPAAEVGMPPV